MNKVNGDDFMNAKTHYNQALAHYLLNTPKKNVLTAIQHFEQAAEMGYADAYYFLGRFYGLGDGVTLDFNKAIELYEEGLSLGSAKCGYALGMMFHSGSGVDKDEEQAKKYFSDQYQMLYIEATHDDPVSMHILGTYYYYGFHVQRYVFSAIEWFLKAAEKGYSDAQYMLGMIYETLGEDGKQTDKAIPFYEKAAAQDHPYAQYALAMLALEQEDYRKAEFFLEKAASQQYMLAAFSLAKLLHDRDSKHPLKAFEWFMVAARQGHAEAAYYVGYYYQYGKGVPQNLDEAVNWYQKAALEKDKDALYHLALILLQNDKPDFKNASTLLGEAAKQGHPNAQYNLAVMYQKGDGVDRSDQKALYWYEKSAEAGLAIAQYNLGMLYFAGEVVEKDEDKAKSLWQKAADQGFDKAVKLMYSINNYEKLQKSKYQN